LKGFQAGVRSPDAGHPGLKSGAAQSPCEPAQSPPSADSPSPSNATARRDAVVAAGALDADAFDERRGAPRVARCPLAILATIAVSLSRAASLSRSTHEPAERRALSGSKSPLCCPGFQAGVRSTRINSMARVSPPKADFERVPNGLVLPRLSSRGALVLKHPPRSPPPRQVVGLARPT
jgi:hypothetical protein